MVVAVSDRRFSLEKERGKGRKVPYGSSFEREIRPIATCLLPLQFSLRAKSRTPMFWSGIVVLGVIRYARKFVTEQFRC